MSRIPRNDFDFNNYINETATYLLTADPVFTTYWERLGFTTAEKNTYIGFKNDWNTKYGIIVNNNAIGVRDSVAIKAKNDVKDDFNGFVLDPEANLLNRIGASTNVNDTDREVFNVKLRDDTLTPRPLITTSPFTDFKGADGAIVIVTCRVESDASRPSMQVDADVIEMKYCLLGLDEAPPAAPEDCPNTETFTKAQSRFEVGMANAGKRLYAFLRWRNNSQPQKSGPWNQLISIVVGD